MTALGETPGQRDLRAGMARVRRLAEPARYRRLAGLEALWKGLQYSSRPSFWDPEVPLSERAPCVNSKIVATGVSRLAAMTFGASKFPRLEVRPRGYGVAYQPAERQALSELLTEVVEQLGLKAAAPQLVEQGLAVSSACVIVGLRAGRLCLQIVPAKDATPELEPDGAVRALEIKYRFTRADAGGKDHHYWYRRVLDAQADRTWPVLPCDAEGYEPAWDLYQPEHVLAHDFCPVVWHRNLPDPTDAGVDGLATYEGAEGNVEALDFALSQRHRSARYNGEPQIVITGVDPEQPIGAAGRTAEPPAGRFSWLSGAFGAARAWMGGGSAIKKAPGTVWRLPQGGDAKLLESSGAGAAILSADADDLARRIHGAAGVVIADPEKVSANASAALMEQIFAPMIAVCDRLREEWGRSLGRVLDTALRLLTTPTAQRDGVHLAALDAALPALQRLYRADTAGQRRWLGVPLELAWGDYFQRSWAEVQSAVAAAKDANGGKPVLSHLRSIKLAAPLTGVDDAETELAAIDSEEQQGQAAMRDVMGALGGPQQPPQQHPAFVAQQDKMKAVAARGEPAAAE